MGTTAEQGLQLSEFSAGHSGAQSTANESTNGNKVNGITVPRSVVFEDIDYGGSPAERRKLPQGMSLIREIANPNFIRGFVGLGGREEREDGLTKVSFPYGVDIEVDAKGSRTLVVHPDSIEEKTVTRRLSLTDAGIRRTKDQNGHSGVEIVFPHDPILDRDTGFRAITLSHYSITEQRVSREAPNNSGLKNIARLLHNRSNLKRMFK